MSADSFHHKIELSLKKTGKVYDFMDFEQFWLDFLCDMEAADLYNDNEN